MPTPKNARGGDRRSGREYGPNRLIYTNICIGCGCTFTATRPDAGYHSNSCRTTHWKREKKRLARVAEIAAATGQPARKKKPSQKSQIIIKKKKN
jgi:hypothetical protein